MGICRRRDARVVVLRHLQRVELRVDVVRGQASVVAARARAEEPVWKSKFYGAFVLNHRVVLHDIDVAQALLRGDAGSSSLDRQDGAPDALVDFHTGKNALRNWAGSPAGSVFCAHMRRSQSPFSRRFIISVQSSS